MRHLVMLPLLVCAAAATAADLALTPGWQTDDWLPRSASVELALSRPPSGPEGQLRVFLGTVDVTDLFVVDGTTLRTRPDAAALPAGQHELVVQLAPPEGEWRELGRFQLKILHPGGFQQAEVTPLIQLDGQGQPDEGHDPADTAPQRETFFDTTARLGLRTEHGRDGLTLTSEIETLGVTYQQDALRFGSEGDDAPRYDLARYHVQLATRAVTLEAGDVVIGAQPQLVEGFASRGLRAAWRPTGWITVTAAGVNGTSIVGWDNVFGLSRSEHRVLTGTVGLELLPSRPGALSLAATWLDASILPLSGFTQGAVTDAEESHGWGVRLRASDAAHRLQLDAGYSESTFTNPDDPGLSQGVELVPVAEVTSAARFARLTYQLLRGVRLSDTQQLNLNLGYRHERAEPLYRSPTAFTQADLDRHRLETNGTIGPVSLAASYTRSDDNLDDIASILTTATRDADANLALPLDRLLAPSRSSPWWPTVSLGWRRSRQYGVGTPVNGGFDPSHIPDQLTTGASAGLSWQGARWRAGYRYAGNDQDNRQPGREHADFTTASHAVSCGLSPGGGFDLGLDLALEDAANVERDETEETVRVSGSVRWEIGAGHALDLRASHTETDNDATGASRHDVEGDATWSWRLQLGTLGGMPLSGRLFLRYSNRQGRTEDPTFDLFDHRLLWTVTTGVNLSWGA